MTLALDPIRRWRCHVLAFSLLALCGCASPPVDLAPPRPDRPWRPSTSGQGEILPQLSSPSDQEHSDHVLPVNTALAVTPAAPAIETGRPYDLAELIDLAQSASPDTRIAWNAARQAALAAGLAKSAYLPRLSASVLGGHQVSHARPSASGVRADSDSNVDGAVSALTLQWLLFDFGERKALVDSANQVTLAAGINFTAAHQTLIHRVSLAYYAYAAARTRSQNAAQSLDDARAVEKAAQARLAHGVGTIVEVAQTRQASAQAQLFKVQAEGATQDAYVTLLAAMGVPPLTKITIAAPADHQLSTHLGADVAQLISDALGRRPDVLAAHSAVLAGEARERAARAAFLPKVFVAANASYATGDLSVTGLPAITPDQPPTLNLDSSRSSGLVLGGITVPIYDGGVRRNAMAQARIRTDTARLTLEQVRNQAIQQIVVADNTLRTSLAAHDAAETLLEAAQTTFDAALTAYRNGLGSAPETLVAERQLLEARNAYADAYSGALSAAATLALATGALGESP
ncbi:MAG: TolC family protein [Caulobacter sp.]|nr:TolC family protein [Caulobacter sp.]